MSNFYFGLTWKIISNIEYSVKVTYLCLTLCDPMDCIVHGILQARILEWVAFPFSRRSSQPRDWTQVPHIAGRFFTSWATREAQLRIQFEITADGNMLTEATKSCFSQQWNCVSLYLDFF